MTSVLVTGATGFLGRQIVRELEARGADVTGTYAHKPADTGDGRTAYRQVDLLDMDAAAMLIRQVRPEILIHAAWDVSSGYVMSDSNDAWYQSTRSLFESFHHAGGRRLVGIGTCAEYSWQDSASLDEESPCLPESKYGEAKLRLARGLESGMLKGECEWVWARPFFLFGPGDVATRLIPRLLRDVVAGRLVEWVHSSLARDYLSVEAAGSAIADLAVGGFQGCVNVASGQAKTVDDLAGIISTALAIPPAHFIDSPATTPRPRIICADVRVLKATGWRLRPSVAVALAHLATSAT